MATPSRWPRSTRTRARPVKRCRRWWPATSPMPEERCAASRFRAMPPARLRASGNISAAAAGSQIGAVSETSALQLNADVLIRFLPAANFNGAAPALTVHLIDNSIAVANGSTQNLVSTGTGGSTAYSTGTISIGETVNAVNDAPVLAPNAGVHHLRQERTRGGDQGRSDARRHRQRLAHRRNSVDHSQLRGRPGRAGLRQPERHHRQL